MSRHSEILEATGTYGVWKSRLRSAVISGIAEPTSAQAGVDGACRFGAWLYGLPEADRSDPYFEKVRELHARFHAEAANVLRLVEAGQAARARMALEPGSDFDLVGRQLTGTLIEWSKAA